MNSTRLRVGACLSALAVAATIFAASPVGAATHNPCKLLKVSEIEATLEQSAAAPKPGIETPVSKSCGWELTAEQGKPGGGVHATLMTTGGDIAFNVNSKRPGSTLVPSLGKAYYSAVTSFSGEIHILKGKTLMTVQIVFVSLSGPKVDPSLIQDEAMQLGKIAKRRF